MRLLALTAVLTLASTGVARAQIPVDSIGRGVAWQLQRTGSPGVIRGVIFSSSGEPLVGAQITIGARIGVIADAQGRFELKPPRGGRLELTIQSIGYRTVRDTLVLPEDLGVFVSAVLRDAAPDVCGLIICRGTDCKDLNITVIDSVSGEMPRTRLTLRVQHRDSVWQREIALTPEAVPSGSIGLGRAITSPGPYDIEIEAPAYHPWRLRDVELSLTEACHPVLRNRDHTARLRPVRQ